MRNAKMLLLLATALSVAALGYAQRGETGAGDFGITRSTIDGGGVMSSTGGVFELSGTIGQPDAGSMEGEGFTLTGGFWFETPPGDCNENGFVDLFDHGDMVGDPDPCLTGPAGSLPPECRCHDIDRDGDVDLSEVARFQVAFTDG